MNGKEVCYKNRDGDCLSVIELISGMGECLNGLGGVIIFQYLENGFILETDDEPELLRFWSDSDQEEGIPEVHIFVIHADPVNVDMGAGVNPYVPPVVDVVGPTTQSQKEGPFMIDIDDYDDVVV
ncbi:hypothetical protein MKX01_033403, partial [Papaver californicum]